MPDTYAVPWPICVVVAGAMASVIGVLWARLIADQEANRNNYLKLLERYHQVVIALHKAIEFKNPGSTTEGSDDHARANPS